MKKKVIFIAEAGVNHNGSLAIAKKMVKIASYSKCDFIKFQTFDPDTLVSRSLSMTKYQRKNIKAAKTQNQMLRELKLSENDHMELVKECKKKKIKFLSTAFDIKSLQFLLKIGLKIIKIPSGEITNTPFLEFIGKQNKKVILSTGMSNMKEIKHALNIIIKNGTKKKNITVLHCNSEYPTPFKDVNLRAMLSIKNKFNIDVGYSDHTLGSSVPIAAVALGASIIEKHFTIDKNMIGPDHKASLEAIKLKQLVQDIRNIELSLGSKIKKVSPSEKKNLRFIRKSIHTKKKINKNQILTEDDLQILRPEGGLHPKFFRKIIGKKSKKKYPTGVKFYG